MVAGQGPTNTILKTITAYRYFGIFGRLTSRYASNSWDNKYLQTALTPQRTVESNSPMHPW